jgi:hypothetical protein
VQHKKNPVYKQYPERAQLIFSLYPDNNCWTRDNYNSPAPHDQAAGAALLAALAARHMHAYPTAELAVGGEYLHDKVLNVERKGNVAWRCRAAALLSA